MALYLDSASIDDARGSAALGFVAGITTNPTLMAATGMSPDDVIPALVDAHPGLVFYQPVARTVEDREAEARSIVRLRPGRIGVKLASTPDNFALARRLAADGIAVGMTAVYSAAQTWLACQTGARFVLPYVNRASRLLGDGPALVREMRAAIDATGARVEILAASIKTPGEAMESVRAGAHCLTIPLPLILELGRHELSEQAIADFDAAVRGTPADHAGREAS